MKRRWHIAVFSICLILGSNYIAGQANAVKIDLVRPLSSFLNEKSIIKVSYEHAFSRHFSAQLTVEDGLFIYKNTFDLSSFREKTAYRIRGFGLLPEFRYYPFTSRKAPQGWFTGIYYSHYFVKENYHFENIDFITRGDIINAGLTVGFKHGTRTSFEYLIGYAPFQTAIWNQPNKRDSMDARQDYSHIPGEVNRLRIELSVGFLF